MARLILTYQNKVQRNFMVPPGAEIIVGRDAGNQMVIDDPSVSGRHAKIRMSDRGLFVTDMGSTNGTFVNEDKVADCQLAHQDWIRIGKHVIIVDLYETLSLDATVQMLKTGASGVADADGTMMLDMEVAKGRAGWASLDYLSFLNDNRPDYELSHKSVTIGKNKDADIVITGFWSWFAGQPTATINRQDGDYVLDYVAGFIKPKLNNATVQGPTRLRHHDVISVGPIKMQLYLAQ
ncbi:MAG: FHA domain-containing protein [Desulfobacteraceae bacterium]